MYSTMSSSHSGILDANATTGPHRGQTSMLLLAFRNAMVCVNEMSGVKHLDGYCDNKLNTLLYELLQFTRPTEWT